MIVEFHGYTFEVFIIVCDLLVLAHSFKLKSLHMCHSFIMDTEAQHNQSDKKITMLS